MEKEEKREYSRYYPEDQYDPKYDLYGKPPIGETFTLGLQHVVAMYVANIVPTILVAQAAGLSGDQRTTLIQAAMLGAGFLTLIQAYPVKFGNFKIGGGIPVVMGLTYIFMPTYINIGAKYGVGMLMGCQIAAGIIPILFGVAFKQLRKLFPPVVTGTIVMTLGFSCFPLAIQNIAGGAGAENYGALQNWLVGFIVIGIILFLQQFTRGLPNISSILIGMGIGYVISVFFGMVNFNPVKTAKIIRLPRILEFGIGFRWDVFIMFSLLYLVASVQMVGDMTVSATGGIGRQATDEELSGGIIGNAVGCMISALFGGFPTATYSQNSGLVSLNKVISRNVVGMAGLILLICGLSPKVGAIMSTIPYPVIGGGTIVVFSMIAMSGVSLVTSEGFSGRSMLIVGISLAVGLGVSQDPESIVKFPEFAQTVFGQSAVVLASIIAVILNLVFPKEKVDKNK